MISFSSLAEQEAAAKEGRIHKTKGLGAALVIACLMPYRSRSSSVICTIDAGCRPRRVACDSDDHRIQ